MENNVRTGRLAGLYWLLGTIAGGYGLSFYRGSIIVAGDAAATAANVVANDSGYRVAIVAILLGQVALFFFGLAIYRLFRDVDRSLALVFLTAILMSVTIAVVNVFNHFGAIHVMSDAAYLHAFTAEQRQAMAMSALRMANVGQGLLEVFWVHYFAAFGWLVLKSRYLPRVFGVLLIAMAVGFGVNLVTKFLIPTLNPAVFTQLAMALGAIGGLPTMLWLLIRGARPQMTQIEMDEHRSDQR